MNDRADSERDRWDRVLVYGLGLSGRAAVRLLLAHGARPDRSNRPDGGAGAVRVVGVDARPESALDLADLVQLAESADGSRFELRAGGEPDALPEGVAAVVVSPGVPLDRPLLADARRRGVPVLAEVELAFPFLDGPVVAVTGSNGKSTTTALAGAMLRAAGWDARVCGNIGEPLSSQVGRSPDADAPAEAGTDSGTGAGRTLYVVELSSFQLSAIHRFRPRAAVFLNLAADHLDRHGTLEEYAAAKRRIFENQHGDDVAVLNADDPLVRATETRSRQLLFSRREEVAAGCFVRGDAVVERGADGGETVLFTAADVPLAGAHNLANAMAAALLARALGAPVEAVRSALAGFRGLSHRMERVAEHRGVTWYDDSKGTNPAATLGCLEGFADGTVHLILGGRNKGNDFAALAPAVATKARRVYLIGESAGEIERDLTGAWTRGAATSGSDSGADARRAPVPISRVETLDRAVAEAAERARAGEAVLLSPACASFDQFRDFNQRGDVFQRLVRTTVGGAAVGQEAGV